MSFEEFYNERMRELTCENAVHRDQNPFKPAISIPLSVDTPYYRDRDIWRHYPNMYDFRRAAIFNTPSAVLYPYNDPARQPNKMPEYMAQQDFKRTAMLTKQTFLPKKIGVEENHHHRPISHHHVGNHIHHQPAHRPPTRTPTRQNSRQK